jgi:acetyl-CoA carboxylase biotin carboxyl carrier protein
MGGLVTRTDPNTHEAVLDRSMSIVHRAPTVPYVWAWEVKIGTKVSEGDVLVILESMKMEMPLEAQTAGRVKEIRCREGQAVSEGDVLAVLE